MFISHLLTHRKKSPKPRFAPGLFLGFLLAFVMLGQTKPVVGLVGIGTTLIVTGVLVILNRQRIWDDYVKLYRKRKGLQGMWTKPNEIYYTINVLFLWPFIIFLGFISLWAAYLLA
jgi:UDP-N-acetylmuramyl pentapeptide phosphotransferase/UDP-N-acetylglucosamine-1-phosphate transferase